MWSGCLQDGRAFLFSRRRADLIDTSNSFFGAKVSPSKLDGGGIGRFGQNSEEAVSADHIMHKQELRTKSVHNPRKDSANTKMINETDSGRCQDPNCIRVLGSAQS